MEIRSLVGMRVSVLATASVRVYGKLVHVNAPPIELRKFDRSIFWPIDFRGALS